MAYRAAPCINLDCLALNLHDAAEPAPERCPKCGGDVLLPRRVRVTPQPPSEATNTPQETHP
jgi:hypothetical protein